MSWKVIEIIESVAVHVPMTSVGMVNNAECDSTAPLANVIDDNKNRAIKSSAGV
jgi:hypothetical protein